jgi:kumamolisin
MIRKCSTFLPVAVVLLSLASSICQAQPQTLMTRHLRDAIANGEAPMVGRLPATQVMHFDIVLALRHAPELENFLQEIYDPSSANYKHFITPREFTSRFGPSQEDYDALIQFANANGFEVTDASRDSRDIQLKGTVNAIEKAFHVTMGVYQHPTETRTFFAPDREPSVDLPFQLWHVSGLDNYSIPHSQIKHNPNTVHSNITGSCPGNSYCGSDMRAAYYGTGSLTGTGQNMALLELAGTDLADLTTYYKNVKQKQPYTPTLISTGGFSTSCLASNGCDDTEQTIDMTQEMGMAPGSKMLYMYVCGDAFGAGNFSETACLSAMVSTKKAPLSLQISSSWSWKPADPSTDDPFYQQMAAQGQSFFDAAGDSAKWTTKNFAYPCEDDHVICVGGTDLITNGAGGSWKSETAWPDSGGGISPDSIPIPSWQQLTGVITTNNKGSKTLRNGPDVAAEANFDFYFCSNQSGCSTGLGGTSFAAPMWAGYMALANQQAVAKGVPAPGFINPTIYPLGLSSGHANAFHDVTSGSNGFPAVSGYDLVTGWGSPNGPGLINALTAPASGPAVSITPGSLTWATVLVGTKVCCKTVTVTNTGSATVTFSSIATTGDFGLMTVATSCKSSLAAGKSCVEKVFFRPTKTGTRTGSLKFTDNAPNSPQKVSLAGTGE